MSGARSSYNNDPEMGVELLELPPTMGSNTHATTTGSSPGPDQGLMIPVRLASAQVPVVDGALDTPEAQGQEQDPVAPAPVRRGFWAFVEKLDFSWYAWPISIGVTSILIHECSVSYPQYHKLLTTTVFFYLVIDVIMFSVITGLTVTRYCRWPNLFSATMKHRRQVGLFAMVPMALGTIINMSTRLVDDNKQTVTTVIWVFWLIEVVLSLVAEIGLTLILPVAAPITAAAAGSDLIVKLGAGLASATFWISYITLALGSFHAMATYPAELVRLAKLLGKRRLRIEHILDIFIPLTALAQSGMAAQQLGAQALRLSNILPPSWENKGLTSSNLSISLGGTSPTRLCRSLDLTGDPDLLGDPLGDHIMDDPDFTGDSDLSGDLLGDLLGDHFMDDSDFVGDPDLIGDSDLLGDLLGDHFMDDSDFVGDPDLIGDSDLLGDLLGDHFMDDSGSLGFSGSMVSPDSLGSPGSIGKLDSLGVSDIVMSPDSSGFSECSGSGY
ncbi:voltage-dependent anion channel-domain-containing protein [Xylaria longipes]|nr:voltage-dependent anion channel-domain-containing protein [Xylaria longipes]